MNIADHLNQLRIIPRGMLVTYMIVFYQTVQWFMTLGEPNMAQAGLVSVITGAGAAWFGLYLSSMDTGGKK
jgi:ABC-type bacteriocin/lantibiotic exporter with double-glycine peptidase domain